MTNEEQQVLGLAGAMQAICIVNDIASNGAFGENEALPILTSLATYSPDDVLTAYGGDVSLLRHGLTTLQRLFNQNINRDLAQYIMMVLTIELKLVRSPQMRDKLQNGLQSLSDDWQQAIQSAHDDAAEETDEESAEDLALWADDANKVLQTDQAILERPQFIEKIASVYKETASKTEPRIMVKGHHQYLQDEKNANTIRAMLLGALRGAAFFRHYGGKRLDFMMKRKQYLEIIQQFKRQ